MSECDRGRCTTWAKLTPHGLKNEGTWWEAARTGKIGAGEILVCDIAEAVVRIRNDERGEAAL